MLSGISSWSSGGEYGGGSRRPFGIGVGCVEIWQKGQYVWKRGLSEVHLEHIARPQQSNRRSCAAGFSVFSSYVGGIDDNSVAQVQHASSVIILRKGQICTRLVIQAGEGNEH